MTATTALELLIDSGLDFEPQCESLNHGVEVVHSGSAAFLQIGDCEHVTGLRCASYVRFALTTPLPGICRICCAPGNCHYIPIPDVTK